jgi:hypothetical protein
MAKKKRIDMLNLLARWLSDLPFENALLHQKPSLGSRDGARANLRLLGLQFTWFFSCLCKEMNLTDTDNAEGQDPSCHRVGDVVNELSASDQPPFNTIIRSRLGLDIAAYLVIPRGALATDPVSAPSRE